MTNFNSILATGLALGFIAIPIAAYAHGDKGEDHIDNSYDFTGFDKIDIGGVYDMDIVVGQDFGVSTSGHAKEVEGIKVYLDGDTLKLENKKKKWKKRKGHHHGVIVKISLPSLNELNIGGVGEGTVAGIDAENFELSIGGVGEFNISGTCKNLDVSVAGVGEVNAKNLKCENTDVSLAGVGEVNVYASESVDISAAGVGEVNVWGKPSKVKKSKGFLSSVTIK